jgi:cytochrome P450
MAIETYAEHFEPLLPPEDVHDTIRFLLSQCPVVHSDRDGGFWVVNKHADLMRVMQDPNHFINGNKGVRIPHIPVDQPPMPPIDSNPPVHRQVRQAMQPYLSPQALAPKEHEFREIISGLVEAFAADGECDIATQLAKVFPAQITLRVLMGVTDPEDLNQVRTWVRRLSYDMFKDTPENLARDQQAWWNWSAALVQSRRREPRRDDILDALMNVTIEGGRLLTDEEVVGAIQILITGGFSTTSDATCNIVCRLIEDPELEPLLRDQPELIPDAIEEILRIDPPVSTRPRLCTADTEIGGTTIHAGERVLCNYAAANVDPDQFRDPDHFDLQRTHNKVVTFGAGPHRCIGSNVARMSLRIMVEELLARVTDLRFADHEARERRVSFNAGAWRAVDSLPVKFTPRGSGR